MTAPDIQLENLLALAETLRGAGFAVGTQQYIAAHELLIALAARGQLPGDPRQWRTLLGPIFCSSPREQVEFAAHFDAWARRLSARQDGPRNRPDEAKAESKLKAVRHSQFDRLRAMFQPHRLKAELRMRVWAFWQWFKRPKALLGTAVIVALAVASVYLSVYLNAETKRTLTGQVVNGKTGQAISGASVSLAGTTVNTDGQGNYRLEYPIRNYDGLVRRPVEKALASLAGYESKESEPVELHRPEPKTISLTPIATPSPTSSSGSTPTKPPTPSPTPVPIVPPPPVQRSFWPTFIPLVLYALWLLWRWWRRRLMLERMQTSQTPRLQQLNLAGDGIKLFDSLAFRRAVVELRRHRHVAANDIDVAATIRATIRQAGLFTPSFGRRRALPEYLLLIDQASLQDEQARLGDELATQFHAGEIGVERYYFQGDARACRQGPLSPTLTLNELAARYPDHRLLVFGDGRGFFDTYTGEAHRWTEQFTQWPERAVITPIEPGSASMPQWGFREAFLQEHGFLLMPANANGFEVLAAWLSSGLVQEPRGTAAHPFPEMLVERPKRWMERRVPRAEEAETLIAQLRRYLGEDAWFWLRACAVYPQVNWELTLYLGVRLLGQTAQRQEAWTNDLLRLVRLPWLRYGTLPDWLRAELIAQFTPEQETQVRGIIQELLRHVLTKPGEAIPLELATPQEKSSRSLQQWLARLKQWWRRRALFRMLQAQPKDGSLRDFVFLSFLAGRRLKPLTVQAPKFWERILFAGGRRALGLQPATLGVMAVLAAAGLFWWFWLKPTIETRPPETGNPPPITRPTVPPNVSLTPTPVPSVTPRVTPTPTVTQTPTPTPTSGTLAGDTPTQSPPPSPSTDLPPDFGAKGEWPVTPIAGGYRVEMGKGVTMELVVVPSGAFMMGSPEKEAERSDNEGPQHRVQITGFNMGKFEVTQEQWLAVMGGKNPSNFQGTNLPVEQVSWNDAKEFCKRLTDKTGVLFRLPTEAEWEYAARAGTTTPFSFGSSLSSEQANFDGNYPYGSAPKGVFRKKTTPVGNFARNAFGLFDMHGNVLEWCEDVWHENYEKAPSDGSAWLSGGDSTFRVLRGGSWDLIGIICRSADRNYYAPGNRNDNVGFRVVVSARTSVP